MITLLYIVISVRISALKSILANITLLLKTAYFGSVFVGGFVQLMMHTINVLYTTLFQLLPARKRDALYVWGRTLLQRKAIVLSL